MEDIKVTRGDALFFLSASFTDPAEEASFGTDLS